MAIILNEKICKGCGCCTDACVEGALELCEHAIVIETYCTECGECMEMCPAEALSL
jgi:NAD-dependent dihydropyrimidine dehydrogenase PreA subunit